MFTISPLTSFITILSFLTISQSRTSGTGNSKGRSKHVKDQTPEDENIPHVIFSIFMGNVVKFYDYIELTIESMRWNPEVDFVLINVLTSPKDSVELNEIRSRIYVPNFHVDYYTFDDISERVYEKLGIEVKFNSTWGRKFADYKPVLAHVFSEHLQPYHKYWGYGDLDGIWGKFSDYTEMFKKGYAFIYSCHWIPCARLSMFINKPWTSTYAFKTDPIFLLLLKNNSHYALDEIGAWNDSGDDQYMEHSIYAITQRYIQSHPGSAELLRISREKPIVIDGSCGQYNYGPVRWFHGHLEIVHGSNTTSPGRPLLMYHRVNKNAISFYPNTIRHEVVQDMIRYGYLLPQFIPFHTRHMCFSISCLGLSQAHNMNNKVNLYQQEVLNQYIPYSESCFNVPNNKTYPY